MKFKEIVYAGHSATFVHTDKFTIAIDPWLEGNPRCPEKLKKPARLDLVVLTHGHSDHAGDVLRLARSYGCKIAATFELAMILVGEGVSEHKVIPMNKGGSTDIEGIKVTLTHAMHSNSFDTENGPVYAGEACGVVLRDESRAIYHAGDTALFSDMALIKEFHSPEVALLPIGDRFTMGPAEAARAAALIGCKVAIPLHYKTFPPLTGTADEFSKHCEKSGIKVHELEPGQSYGF
jgi:L-ascorbate metabolism protein UlaG (beta-lactamase superfamily)